MDSKKNTILDVTGTHEETRMLRTSLHVSR